MEESLPGKKVSFKDSESALNSRSDMGYCQKKRECPDILYFFGYLASSVPFLPQTHLYRLLHFSRST